MSSFVSGSASSAQRLMALAATPAVIIFIASNFVNVGNLAFNMIFSRLMGPEMFGVLALLLTIKLALLGVMGAVQTAVSQQIAASARDERKNTEQALSRINRLLLTGLILLGLPLAVSLMLAGTVGARLGLPDAHLLIILLAAVPFGASLSLLRGVAFGDLNAGRIAISANVEMVVRLVGALIAWQAGFGLTGVIAAISLSIVAGWVVLFDLLPRPARAYSVGTRKIAQSLTLAALPFGFLQLAQVLSLDGEIFLAQVLLPAHEAGQVAALSLFQRIQFFACFALASVLLPGVVIAARQMAAIGAAAMPVVLLFAGVSTALILAVLAAPETMVTLLVGPAYVDAAAVLLPAVVAAVAFTLSYLAATFLAALGDRSGIAVVFCAALFQLALMGASGAETMLDLIRIKLGCQLATAALVTITAVRALRRRNG